MQRLREIEWQNAMAIFIVVMWFCFLILSAVGIWWAIEWMGDIRDALQTIAGEK